MLWSSNDNTLKNPIRGTRSMHVQDNVLRNIWSAQKDNMDKDSKRDKNNESPNKSKIKAEAISTNPRISLVT